jgi:hypothetical protein
MGPYTMHSLSSVLLKALGRPTQCRRLRVGKRRHDPAAVRPKRESTARPCRSRTSTRERLGTLLPR